MGGTIYCPELEPLKNLGLDPQKATKLAVKLHAHSIHITLQKTFATNDHKD